MAVQVKVVCWGGDGHGRVGDGHGQEADKVVEEVDKPKLFGVEPFSSQSFF